MPLQIVKNGVALEVSFQNNITIITNRAEMILVAELIFANFLIIGALPLIVNNEPIHH